MWILVLLVSIVNFFFLTAVLLQVFGWLTCNIQIPILNRANRLFKIPYYYTITVDNEDPNSKTFKSNEKKDNDESSDSESEEETKFENQNLAKSDEKTKHNESTEKDEDTEVEESEDEQQKSSLESNNNCGSEEEKEVKKPVVNLNDLLELSEGLKIKKNKILIDESLD